MKCDLCRSITPIEDQGVVLIRITGQSVLLQETAYSSKEELLQMLNKDAFPRNQNPETELEMTILCTGSIQTSNCCNGWLPLSVWKSRLEHYDLVDIIHKNKFMSHMQPILRADGSGVYGYEFLLRPIENEVNFSPYELFRVAQETGFHSFLDRAARVSAIEAGARYLPQGVKRFVNFLPSSIYNPNYCLTHTLKSIRDLKQDPADFVFEVVETEEIVDVEHLLAIFGVYKQSGSKVALDDVGAGHATLDVLTRLKPDYVKIDRGLVSFSDMYDDRRRQLEQIVEISRSFGAVVLAEGLEREEEFQVCKAAGVSLVQGYMFGKPGPRPLDGLPAA